MIHRQFSEDLFLTNETGKHLYNAYAKDMPIIDYHCHLQPKLIYENKEFADIGELWLSGDHYKWRAMREFGIDEQYITGSASYHDKYIAFASIYPKLAGNPLYIWCALELKRFFDIDTPLSPETAEDIYQRSLNAIKTQHITPQWCMERCNVQIVSTTEDPVDDLHYHIQLRDEKKCRVKVISAFRPDKAMFCTAPGFAAYISSLAKSAGLGIRSVYDLFKALDKRLQFFRQIGTTVSDDGIPWFEWRPVSEQQADAVFQKALAGQPVSHDEEAQYRSYFLLNMGRLYKKNGFVMQLHVGTYLDANTKGVREIGQSTGFDCNDDRTSVWDVGELLNALNLKDELPKTILYTLNFAATESFSILAGGFCGDGIKGKVQLGAPWWFHDQAFGIQHYFESCSNFYPLALSVGMLTDSRSFLSYPRHELYRRILCNYLGQLCERGEYFGSEENLRQIIQDICYNNVKAYFEL